MTTQQVPELEPKQVGQSEARLPVELAEDCFEAARKAQEAELQQREQVQVEQVLEQEPYSWRLSSQSTR